MLILSTEGMSPISIDLAATHGQTKAIIKGQTVPACDCGEEVAKWLSRFLLQKEEGLRLVYYPKTESSRKIIEVERAWEHMKEFDIVR